MLLALLTTAIVQVIAKGSIERLFFPIRRFWLLFLFVACLHLFFSYGTRLQWASFVTQEGVEATIVQSLRLWSWLQMTFIFTHFKFHTVIFRILTLLFRSHRSTLYAGLMSMEDFPEVFNLARKRISMEFRPMLRHPIATSEHAISQTFYDVAGSIVRRHGAEWVEEQALYAVSAQ